MKKAFFITLLLLISLGCKKEIESSAKEEVSSTKKNEFAIIIHGGAGTILKKNMSDEKETEYKTKLEEAVKVGYTILKNGGTSQEAVMKTIQVMEESPLFNSGKGAVFTHEETNELDYDDKMAVFYDSDIKNAKFGTVGCVALDKDGNISAGTSTGGMTNKRYGRIGDSPIIGSGTYANNNTCGVSSTGWGEYFIRNQVAYDISAQMEYKNSSLKEATQDVIQNKLTKLGGTGGVVALDKNGNMSFEFNTAGMYRASMDDKGSLVIKIYKE